MGNSQRIDWKTLRGYCQELFCSQGMSPEDALTVADVLVDADLCGVGSHGVSRMSVYMKRLACGVVNSRFEPRIQQEYAASICIDANNAMGMVAGKFAMERCISKARENGSCFAAVSNSNHFGVTSYYVRLAAEAGMFGFASTNAPPNIAPWGSYQPYMGTNPLAFAVPTEGEPIILDMAPSVVAMGKVILAAKLGKPIPEGWALTADGKPTTDASLGMKGSVVPIGGPKGCGLSLFADILCGVLAGAQFGPHLGNMWNDFTNPQNVGHVFYAVDITKFVPLDIFTSRLAQMVAEIKDSPRIDGVDQLFVPGEIEQRNKDQQKVEGVDLPEVVLDELKTLGATYKVACPL
jgi:Malate/L-lactate dehydrogenases